MFAKLHHQAINFTIQHPALLQTVQSFAREISPPAATPIVPDQVTPPANENATQKPSRKNEPTRAPKLSSILWCGNAAKALGTSALALTTIGFVDGFWAGAVAFAGGTLAAFKIPNPAIALARDAICLDLKHGNPDDAQVASHIATLRSLGMSDSDIYDQACPFLVFPNGFPDDKEPTQGIDSWRVFLEKNFEDGLLGFGMKKRPGISNTLYRLGMRESLPTMLKTLQETRYDVVFSRTLAFIAKFPDSPEFEAVLEEIAKRSLTGSLILYDSLTAETPTKHLGDSFCHLIKTPSGCDKFSAKISALIRDKVTPKESRIELAQHLCRLEKTPAVLGTIEAITWDLLQITSDIDRFDILKAMVAEMISSESTRKSCAGVLRTIVKDLAKTPDYVMSDIQMIELLYPVTAR